MSPATRVSQRYYRLISAEEDEPVKFEDFDDVEEEHASDIDTCDDDDQEDNRCDPYGNVGDVPMADMMDDEEWELSRLKALSGKSRVHPV